MSIRDDFTLRNIIVLGLLAFLALILIGISGSSITESVEEDIFERYGTDYGAVLVMDFEEGQGTIAYDQSPYGNDGTVYGAGWTWGKYGEALYFDGDSNVTIPDSYSLDLADNITIEAWAKDPPIEIDLEGFNIVGDAVVVDDNRAYLSVNPHTITSSAWVEFTLISKQYSGDIDVVWGFNSSVTRPTRPQIWANYTHTLWRWVESFYIGINETTLEPYNYTSYEKEYYESTFFDWKDVNLDFNKVNKNAKGMDTWYVLKGVSIVAEKEYRLRCWVEIPFDGNNLVTGKYAWGIKLSSDTIQEAIDSDRFYFIDPWYNSGWLFRTEIVTDSGDVDEILTDFTVMVYLNDTRINWEHVQDDLDDLRFTSDDEVTLLDYEIEDYTTNVEAWIWVKLPTISNTSDTIFYMYYGNAGATNGEDKEGTWDDNYVMVQHMVDETTSTVLDSTQYDNDGAKIGANEPIETADGKINSAQDFDGTNDYVDVPDSPSILTDSTITYSCWFKSDDIPVLDSAAMERYYGQFGIHVAPISSGSRIFGRLRTVDAFFTAWTAVVIDTDWHYTLATYDKNGGIDNFKFYIDGIEIVVVNATGSISDSGNWRIGSGTGTGFWNGTVDEVRISNTVRNPSWIFASYESESDDFLTYGYETIEKILVQKFRAYTLGISDTSTLVGMINTTYSTYEIDTVTDWHYYSMTYDGSNIRLYIDGILVNTTASSGSIALNDNDVSIGKRFVGEIDQVRIYDVTKTVEEIQNHYLNTGHMYSRSVSVSDDFRVLNSTLDEQLSVYEGGIDFNGKYMLNMPLETWVHHDTIGGADREHVMDIPLGSTFQDKYYFKMIVTVDQPPGDGKTVNTTLTDGTNSMTVLITGAVDVAGSTTVNAFILDVSADTMTLEESQTAGGASEQSAILLLWYYVENG